MMKRKRGTTYIYKEHVSTNADSCIYPGTRMTPPHHASPTGWRRLIGSPKLQIIFHKRATKYRSLLRKMTHKDEGSYESSPPCTDTLSDDAKETGYNVYIENIYLYKCKHTHIPRHSHDSSASHHTGRHTYT